MDHPTLPVSVPAVTTPTGPHESGPPPDCEELTPAGCVPGVPVVGMLPTAIVSLPPTPPPIPPVVTFTSTCEFAPKLIVPVGLVLNSVRLPSVVETTALAATDKAPDPALA